MAYKPKSEIKEKRLTAGVAEDLYKKVNKAAKGQGMSVSYYIRQALLEKLAREARKAKTQETE